MNARLNYLGLMFLALLLIIVTSAAQATSYYVSTAGNDTNDGSSGTPWATIQHAVSSATFGDTINVSAGTYNEVVSITISLTLNGAQQGTAGSSHIGAESIVTAFNVTNANVVIDGFQIISGVSNGGVCLLFHGGTSEKIQNNIISGYNSEGVGFFGTNGMLIQHNLFENPTPSGLDGIFAGGGVSNNLQILNNVFNHASIFPGTDIGLSYTSGINPVISGNTSTGGATLVALFNSAGGLIINNSFAGDTSYSGSIIYIGGGNSTTTVSGNIVSGASGGGVAIKNVFSAGVNIATSITGNTITGNIIGIDVGSGAVNVGEIITAHLNTITGNTTGVRNLSTGVVDATNNWWGSSTGPKAASNPGGLGDSVTTNVNYDPWTGKGYPKAVPYWPIGGISVFSTTPTFIWYLTYILPGSITYDLMIRKSSNPSYSGSYPDYILQSGITSTSFTLPDSNKLTGGQKYYYKIRTNYSGGVFTLSNEDSLIVDPSQDGAPQPVASWPTGNVDVFSATPGLVWYLSSFSYGGILTYDVEIEPYTTPFTDTPSPGLSNISGSSVTVPSNLDGGTKYHWQVRTMNSNNPTPSAWSAEAVFTVDSSEGGAPLPVQAYPVGTTIYSTSPTIYWYLGSFAYGTISYDGVISDLTNPLLPDITFSTANTYYPVSGLIGGHSYSWRVQTHNGFNSSGYAAADSFYVDPGQIPAPKPIAFWPAGNGAVFSLNPVLTWYLSSAASGNPTYTIEISNVSGDYSSSSFHHTYSSQPGFYFTVPDTLTAGVQYFWHVMTVNGPDSSVFSDEASFTVDISQAGNPTPVAYWPNGGATVYTPTPTFTWYISHLAAGTATYTIEVKLSSDPFDSTTANPIFLTGISGTSYTPSSPLAFGTSYHWRVRLNSSFAGNSNWSDEGTFSTFAPSPKIVVAPVIGSPFGGAVISSKNTTLSWFLPTASTSNQTYRVEIAQNPNMANPIISLDNVTDYKKVISSLGAGIYYWRVQAKTSDGGYSNYSKVASFTIGSVTGVTKSSNGIPATFAVSQNYPNPFNPSTSINYALPKSSLVTIRIYNILGQEVKTLINSEQQAGIYTAQWNGDNYLGVPAASGIYIYRVTAGQYVKTMKMMLLK